MSVKTAQFKVVQNNFRRGLWTIETVKKAVKVGKITAEQFKEITGEDYTEE